MQKMSVVLGFVPWIVFSVLSGPSTWQWAAPTALVATLVLAVPDWRRSGEIGVLDAGGATFFAALTVLALILERSRLQWLEDRAALISGIAITVIAVASLLLRRPFTEHYARQSTPREYWGSPLFRHVNVMITGVWAATFALQAVSALIVLTTPGLADLFGWVVPTLLLVAAVKFTMWYPDHATADVRADAAPRVAS
ncbi:hypothetical protein [Actinomycetospora soli]|uniref:hypothetical protein n=1 Tax=Actinomycetospora soli TaxID=2893887 RepID=UPI001E54298F|nr:hypothetical protein [Actinomycetospora soli]MCD2185869.1 hypothetical protein [Actinomycetospora soli]